MQPGKLAVGLALAVQAAFLFAQDWPQKPVKLIIGFPPGGGADAVARPIAEALSRELGQPVIVDNRPGAGTTIAAAASASAEPDGYTLYMSNASIYGSLQAMYKDFKYAGKDFTPISRWTMAPLLVAVSNELGANSVPELIARAKAEPGKLNYASSGVGGGTHLPGVLFTKMAGVDVMHVPYKGGAPALQGIVAGETQLSFATPPSVLPLARAGRLKVIAVTSGERSSLFPDLPTVAEGGVPGYDYTFWFGLFGPKGLPEPIVNRLFEASRKVLQDPALRQTLEASGNGAAPSDSPQEFGQWAATSGDKERELLVQAGVVGN
jgi:tripartite-type tricarboxylate transporter receptor subunit TctC